MAGLGRASSFLPTIKCSMCARDIDIAMMGDHVCGVSGEPTPPPDSSGNFDRMPFKGNFNNLKPGRSIPARVDTSAANRPFFSQDQLTPVSASPSRSASPMTPNGLRSPFRVPIRSATGPSMQGLPSPEHLSPDSENAFAPFPAQKNTGWQSRANEASGYGANGLNSPGVNPMYAPISPRTAVSGGLLQRMNTIAPGPFDISGRRQVGGASASSSPQKNRPVADRKAVGEVIGYDRRPSTAGSGHSRNLSTNSSNGSRSGSSAPPRVPRKGGYGGFGRPAADDDFERGRPQMGDRSQTFPRENPNQEPSFRRPSEPAAVSRVRRPSAASNESRQMGMERSATVSPPRGRKQSIGPDLSRSPPPRASSGLTRSRTDAKIGNGPQGYGNLDLAAEFGIGNPYHTPSESQSSNGSGYSEGSKASSRSSPPKSVSSGRMGRKVSDTSKLDLIMSEVQSSMAELRPKEIPKTGSPGNNTRNQFARPLASPPSPNPALLSPDSPMDPAVQGGRFSPVAPRKVPRPEAALPGLHKEKPVQQSTASKGNCRGCGDAIKGKSVSSADGRLTGRYHKQCFVCTTCVEPFTTSTFYVHNNSPYCERHYHKLNGSVCTSCDRGIEGQYLETERKQKFHPACLTCTDCKRRLKNDYFEMNGKVYCERDAFRRGQQGRFLGPGGGGTNRIERRTTRLMMM